MSYFVIIFCFALPCAILSAVIEPPRQGITLDSMFDFSVEVIEPIAQEGEEDVFIQPSSLLSSLVRLMDAVLCIVKGIKEEKAPQFSDDWEISFRDEFGWSSMPSVLDRPDAGSSDTSDSFLLNCSPSDMIDILSIPSPLGTAPQNLPTGNFRTRWPFLVERLQQTSNSRDIEAYEVLKLRFDRIFLDADTGISKKGKNDLKTIRKDSFRHGFREDSFEADYTSENLSQDCSEICGVYSLVKDPELGYIQGMMDLCMMLKLKGRMSNEEVFYGLSVLVEGVIQANVSNGSDLLERAFVWVQLYTHMFAQLEGLKSPTVFEKISQAFVVHDEMPIGHELGNKFYSFLLSAGMRGDPKEGMVPITDFVLLNGRAGLVSIFLANLSINLDLLETLVGEGNHFAASQIFANPFAARSKCTVESLLEKANQYLETRVGRTSFSQAVAILDAFGSRLVSSL